MKKYLVGVWLAASFMGGLTFAAAEVEIKVLLIGDSHTTGLFGRTLDQYLRDGGLEVETHARPSATANWFFTGENRVAYPGFDREVGAAKGTRAAKVPTPKLPELLVKLKPEYTVVALGSNSEWLDKKPLSAQIHRVITAIHEAGSKCIWIAPPDMNSVPESTRVHFYAVLTEVTAEASCELVDSFKILGKHPACVPGAGPCDPIHWDGYPTRAKAWAHAVGDRVLAIVHPAESGE